MKKDNYEDIVNLPYNKSKRHKPMSLHDRAAQFSPFAALTGYEAAVRETERVTEVKAEQSEDEQEYINEKLRVIEENIDLMPEVKLIYFKKDEKKQGGEYVTFIGKIKKLDKYKSVLITEECENIPFEYIRNIDGEIFDRLR